MLASLAERGHARGLVTSSLRSAVSAVLLRKIRPPELWVKERLATLGLVALVLCLFPEAVFRGRAFYQRDIHLQWYGQMESFVRAAGGGSWPLWDLYASFGQPLLANANNQLLYPPTWVNLLLRPWTYFTVYVVLHSLFSALGLYALAQRLGISRFGSWVAAAVWMTSGPLLSFVNLWNHFAGAAWLPWVFLAADRTLVHLRPVDALAWGGGMAAQILAGSPDMFAMTSLLVGAYSLRFLRWREPGHPLNRRLLAVTVLAWGFALGLSAAQWMPSLDLVRQSARWRLPVEMRAGWSLHPLNLVQAVLPVASDDLVLNAEYRAALFGGREPLLSSIYLGMAAAGLVAAALARRRGTIWFFALAAAGGILFAMGYHSPAYEAALRILPPLKMLRFPSKALIITAFGWAVMAGAGVDAWSEQDAGRRRRWRITVVAPLVVIVGLAISAAFVIGDGGGAAGDGLASARAVGLSALLASAVLILALRRGSNDDRWAAVVASLLAVVDLLCANRGLNPTAPRELFAFRPPVVDAVDQGDGRRLYVYDYLAAAGLSRRHLERDAPYLTLPAPKSLEWTEALAMRTYLSRAVAGGHGLYSSYDADVLGIQPRFLTLLTDALLRSEGTPLHLRLLRMGAVSYVMALHREGLEELVPVQTFRSLFPEPIRLFRVPNPLPRTYAVGGVRIADGTGAVAAIEDSGFDPAREIVLPEGVPSVPSRTFSGTSRLVWLKPDRLRVEADLSEPGYVVLVDAYGPGWRATVDGRDVPVIRANIAFRAIRVGAGRHIIDSVYRPRSLMAGLGISVATLIVLAGAFLVPHLRPTRRSLLDSVPSPR